MQREKLLNGFSARLREVRKSKKMTQGQFAEALCVSKATYVRYELGEMMPKLQILPILEDEYKVDLNWLITGKGEMEHVKGLDYLRSINPAVDDPRYIELLELCNV
ncbi:MAG: helix-turn-helix transcriptional regulator, partial [bacterium]|nr:helix-turn-helix transcriptional regulator [bacterium]